MAKHFGILLVCLLARPSFAEPEEDELAPLSPVKPKPKPKVQPVKKASPPPRAGVSSKAPAASRRAGSRSVDDELAPLVPVAASNGELVVRVGGGVKGASLSLDGKAVGPLPTSAQSVSPGEHLVTVTRPGYSVFTRKVNVPRGKTVELEAKLTAVAAVLAVKCDLWGAEVTVDGRVVGLTPVEAVEVPPGSVELELTKGGYREHRQRIAVVAGREYPVVVTLERLVEPEADVPVASSLLPKEPGEMELQVRQPVVKPEVPLSQRWYFWAGVGVVVAGAALGTVAGVTAALPPRSHSPADLCRGACNGCVGPSCNGVRPFGISF